MIEALKEVFNFIIETYTLIIDIIKENQISDYETAITMIKSGEISGIIIGILAIIQIIIDKIT